MPKNKPEKPVASFEVDVSAIPAPSNWPAQSGIFHAMLDGKLLEIDVRPIRDRSGREIESKSITYGGEKVKGAIDLSDNQMAAHLVQAGILRRAPKKNESKPAPDAPAKTKSKAVQPPKPGGEE